MSSYAGNQAPGPQKYKIFFVWTSRQTYITVLFIDVPVENAHGKR
jgi:hypothetical protein